MDAKQALEALYGQAIQSRTLPPAALPELQKMFQVVMQALEPKEKSKNAKI